MQIEFSTIDFRLLDLMRLNILRLGEMRTDHGILLNCVVPEAGVRYVVKVAPNGYSWGMIPSHSKYSIGLPDRFESERNAKYFPDALNSISVHELEESILLRGLGYFPEQVPANQYWCWANAIDSSDESFAYYCYVLKEFCAQLKGFCLHQRPALATEYFLDQTVTPLGRLFINRPGRALLDSTEERAIPRELEHWLDSSSVASLNDMMNADFIRRGPSVEFPIGDELSKGELNAMRRGHSIVVSLGFDPYELLELRKGRSLLRVKLLRRLGWPLGYRSLKESSEPSAREFTLKGARPYADLDEEVSGYLAECEERFPILLVDWENRYQRPESVSEGP